MEYVPFSEREGLEEPVSLLPYDELPDGAREDFIDEFTDCIFPRGGPFTDGEFLAIRYDQTIAEIYDGMRAVLWELDGKRPDRNSYEDQLDHVIDAIRICPWTKFYEICEELYRHIDERESFVRVVNSRFRFHRLAWRYDDQGRITRVWPEHVQQALTVARRHFGNEERFAAAFAQFNKAVNLIQQRPDPDYANAIKDVVGATESVSNIIKGTKGSTLSSLMDQAPYREEIDPTIFGSHKEGICLSWKRGSSRSWCKG